MLKHWMLNARSGFLSPSIHVTFIVSWSELMLSWRLIHDEVWMDGDLPAVFGDRWPKSKRSGRVLVVTDEIGLREMELPQNFPGGVFFLQQNILRPEVSWNKGWMFAWAACLYIIYVRVYCKQRICMLNSPGFLFPLPTWMWRWMMFWVGYNNLFMEPIFGPLTNDT